MNRHTPGPWRWDAGWLNSPSTDNLLYYTTSDDGLHGRREDMALVAAAPELLEALEAVKRSFEERPEAFNDTLWATPTETLYDAVCAAIAKAKGEV